MLDVTSILATVGGGVAVVDSVIKTLKGAKELAKKEGLDPSDLAVINKRVAEAYEQLVEVKEAQLALLQAAITFQAEKAAFERERADSQNSLSKLSDYVLTDVIPGISFAYILKPGVRPDEPRHFMCAHCIDNRKLPLLQLHERQFNFDILTCQTCGSTIQCPNDVRAEVRTVSRAQDDFLRSGWRDL